MSTTTTQRLPQKAPTESTTEVRVVETSDATLASRSAWAPLKIPATRINEVIEQLAAAPVPSGGRRSASLVHPQSVGRGLAPGIEVSVEVLLPGERTTPLRRNASLVQISVRGSGTVNVDGTSMALRERDVCTVPSMKPHVFENPGQELWARLSYSNAPLLSYLGVHYWEAVDADWRPAAAIDGPVDMEEPADAGPYTRETAPDFVVSERGARLRGYEYLVDIEPLPNPPLHWPYAAMSDLMSQTAGDGLRTIMALYNPATERKQGATNSFFVTLSQLPPGHKPRAEGPGHRHSSVAINYHLDGVGYSVVDGQRIDWGPGDLLLSAPSWREHTHYPSETGWRVYTVQDHPLHIGMESLIWQEDMSGPILALGSESGLTGYVAPRQTGD